MKQHWTECNFEQHGLVLSTYNKSQKLNMESHWQAVHQQAWVEHLAELDEAPHRMASVHILVEVMSSEPKSGTSEIQSWR